LGFRDAEVKIISFVEWLGFIIAVRGLDIDGLSPLAVGSV